MYGWVEGGWIKYAFFFIFNTEHLTHMFERTLSSEGFVGFWLRTLSLRKLKIDCEKCQDLCLVDFPGKGSRQKKNDQIWLTHVVSL